MNIFYAPPSQVTSGFVELKDQEAVHASKVLRASEGDLLHVVDGEGCRYRGPIRRITNESVQVEIEHQQQDAPPDPTVILGMGIIKKRDRLEFAVEKAVELGVSRICLFRSQRTIKDNVRMDRLDSIAISAMKQSLRAWLPEISFYQSFENMIDDFSEAAFFAAHEKIDTDVFNIDLAEWENEKLLLLVGPEGGFTSDEIGTLKERNARLVSLGSNRLRTETAAVAFLSQFL